MLREFREFAVRGNVLDMAVGIVVGAAFGTIVQSLVNDVFMPPIGLLVGGVDFTELFVTLSEGTTPGPYPTLQAAEAAGAVTINYGRFLNTVVSFVLIAFAVFLAVRAFNRLQRRKEALAVEEPAAKEVEEVPVRSPEEALLTEIRDVLHDRL